MTEDKNSQATPINLPTHAQVVIIGGGVIGCSVAYHLTKLGWRDVVLLERSQLTAGTTWHAAGLVVSGLGNETLLYMAKYSRELYARLGAETGQATGFKPIGYLRPASNLEQLYSQRRRANFARAHGVDTVEVSATEITGMWPLLDTSDILAGFFTAADGRTNPVDTTISLAKGARMGGATIAEGIKVTGISQDQGRVTGVVTDKGDLNAEYVINCGGIWARELGKLAGVNIPLHAAEHFYLVTEPIEGIHPDLSIVEDPDRFAYYREETGGLLLGLFEPVASPWGMSGIPQDFSFGEIQPDLDRLMPYIENAVERIPVLKEAGIRKFFSGPESFTPDMGIIMGEAPELENFFVAAGFNSMGIMFGGGAGQVLAQWVVDGLPPVDVSKINIDRMVPFQNNAKYLHDRIVEMLGWQYVSWPNFHPVKARNIRQSALHERLAKAGAYFGESFGWEYPDWFAPEGVDPHVKYSWGRQNWFEYSASEHRAAREAVILMDSTHMSKLLVSGMDVEKHLNRICANNISVPVGRIVYTQWLNECGLIEADMTVTRLAENSYFLVVADAFQTHVETWLKRNVPPEAHFFVSDLTSAYNILNVQGPKSRQLISRLTHAKMSNEAFPYLSMQEIDIGYALVKALRVTYVGELGWELYVPSEFAPYVFDELTQAGVEFGLKFAGFQALRTLRLEKAYRDYGSDIDNTITPLEAGLNFAVDYDKPGGFIGREALLHHKESGNLRFRLAQFLLEEPEPLLYGGEQIFRDGVRVGTIKSGGYGHTLGGAVGLGEVGNEEGVSVDFIQSGSYEIEVSNERIPAKISLRPMYDPDGIRVRS